MRILTCLLAFFSLPLFAANHIAFIGGGGEPVGDRTIFDADVNRFGSFMKRMPEDTSLSVSFNGGHSRTESRLANNFPATSSTPFTPGNYEAMISRYEKDIREGRITSSDQLMLYINTHGAEAIPGQSTHSIATTGGAVANYDNLSGARTVSLDRLRSLTTLAETRGIKLAIIDVSCHSGSTLSLANSKTCVITASGPRHYGFVGTGSFSANFINRMRPGITLDQVFHEVRDDSADTDFPMISSPAGREVQDQIYPLLTRFLFDYERNNPSKLRVDIIDSITKNTCEQEDESLAQLIALLSQVENATNENFRGLREAVSEYQILRSNMQNQIRGMLTNPALTETRQVCHGGQCFSYTGREVIAMDIPGAIRAAKTAEINSPEFATFYQNWAKTLNQLTPWKAQLQANPTVSGFTNYFDNYPSLERKSEGLAARISREERRLYREMYNEARANDQRPNPCQDFRL